MQRKGSALPEGAPVLKTNSQQGNGSPRCCWHSGMPFVRSSVHCWSWWSSHATGSSRKPIRLSPKIPLSAEQSVFPTCVRMSYRSRTAPCVHLHKSKPVLGSRGAEERPDGTWGSCTHLSTKQTWRQIMLILISPVSVAERAQEKTWTSCGPCIPHGTGTFSHVPISTTVPPNKNRVQVTNASHVYGPCYRR